MCRIKGFVRQLRLRFVKKPRETVQSRTDAEHAAKLRKLAKKQKELEGLRNKK